MKKIFIVHGWTYTTSAWDSFLSKLSEKGFAPELLHVPGLTEKSDKIWTLESYVEWLHGKIKHETDVVLMGHSNGGRIAIAYANAYPRHLSKLILIDSAGLLRKSLPIRLKRFIFGGVAKAAKHFIDLSFARKVFYKLIRAKDYERAPVNMRETMKNLIVIDLKEILKNITIPTLIIWGKKDKETPVSDAYIMEKEIPDSRLFVINDARHSPHMTNAEEVAEVIAEFV